MGMLRLKHQDVLNFNKWIHMIYTGYIVCIGLLVAAELISIRYLYGFPNRDNRGDWLRFVVLPVVFFICVLGVAFLLLRYYERQNKVAMQAYVDVVAASFSVFFVAYVHYNFSLVYVVFVFPFLAALFFIDIKPLVLAYVLNTIGYLYIALIHLPHRNEPDVVAQGFTEVITMIAFMTASFAICVTILQLLSLLVENIIQQNNALKRDSFTSLLNHTAFYEHLGQMVACGRTTGPALILWDIDDFKAVNDQYGHDMGDQVILLFSECLKAHTKGEEYCFRYGGEEFGALSWRDKNEAMELAENVRKAFSARASRLPINHRLTACAGVGVYREADFRDEQHFFSDVDRTLYRAKRTPGKDTACLYDANVLDVVPAKRKTDLLQKAD